MFWKLPFKNLQTNNREIEERFSDFIQHNESVFNQSIADLENSLMVQVQTFNCTKCNFTSESERGLKVHIKRKHEKIEETEKTCDFCDCKCYSKQGIEDHLKEY